MTATRARHLALGQEALRTRFGFTPEHVVRAARNALARARRVAR